MAEFQRVVNWTAPDASARVNQLARERITSYVTDYLARGNDALSSQAIVHVTHLVTWRDPSRTDRLLIAQKQIYASHYYDGSLAVSAILDAPAVDGRPASDLLYFSRGRGDLLKGGFGGLRQRVARDQAKKAAIQTLTIIRDALERR